jgi:hypothetical protein
MPTPANLFAALVFSTIGMAGLAYGKKAGCVYPILFGAALMFYPYFISQTWLLYAIGVALTAMLVQFRDR